MIARGGVSSISARKGAESLRHGLARRPTSRCASYPQAVGVLVKLLTEIDEKLPRGLMLDEVRLRQVLFNVVGNALKFTEKGQVKIRAWAEYADRSADFSPQDGSNAEAHRTDMGVPPDPEALRTEVRAPSEPDETRVNLILGESEPGEGAKFVVQLPAA